MSVYRNDMTQYLINRYKLERADWKNDKVKYNEYEMKGDNIYIGLKT